MRMKKILPVICLCGALLPLTCGCGKKEDETAKTGKNAAAGSSELSNTKQIAAPGQKRRKGGDSPYTEKTFAKKGRPDSDEGQVVTSRLKKKTSTSEDTEGTEEETEE